MARRGRALTRAQLGNYRKAIEQARLALQLDPASAKAHFRIAQAHAALYEFDEAAASVARALALQPTNAELLRLRDALARQRAEAAARDRAFERLLARRLAAGADADADAAAAATPPQPPPAKPPAAPPAEAKGACAGDGTCAHCSGAPGV
jgi:tetratricopeptide (TPR) repeat protein